MTQPERAGLGQPGPLQRRGPRPLLLHLTLAMLKSSASLTALPNSSAGWAGWSTALAEQARAMQAALAQPAAARRA